MQSTNNLFEDQMEEQRNNLNIEEPFKNLTQEQNNRQNYYPLTTGRKSQQYKNVLNRVISGEEKGDS